MNMLAFDTCLDKTYVTLYNGVDFQNKIILLAFIFFRIMMTYYYKQQIGVFLC